jgi:hypothetical protein
MLFWKAMIMFPGTILFWGINDDGLVKKLYTGLSIP